MQPLGKKVYLLKRYSPSDSFCTFFFWECICLLSTKSECAELWAGVLALCQTDKTRNDLNHVSHMLQTDSTMIMITESDERFFLISPRE